MKLIIKITIIIIVGLLFQLKSFGFEEDFDKITKLERPKVFSDEKTREFSKQHGYKILTTSNDSYPFKIHGYFDTVFEADSKIDDIVRNMPQNPELYRLYEESTWTILNTLKLEAITKPKDNIETKISAIGRMETLNIEDDGLPDSLNKVSIKDLYLDESFIHIYLNNSEFRAGLLNFNYGLVEENSPIDKINPENMFRYNLELKNDRILPIPAVEFHFGEEVYSFDSFFGLYRKSNRDPDHDSEWKQHSQKQSLLWEAKQLTTIIDNRPNWSLKNFVSGGRLIRHGNKYLAGITYLNTWDYTNRYIGSDYRVLTGENVPEYVNIENKRNTIFGIFGQTTWNEIELKGELGYYEKYWFDYRYQSPNSDDNLISKKKLSYVFEAAHSFDETSRILIQYMHNYILNWTDIIDFPESEHKVYYHLIKEIPSRNITFDIRFSQNFTFDELYFRPRLKWVYSNFETILGADLFWGENKTRGWGQFDDNDQFSLKFRYNF